MKFLLSQVKNGLELLLGYMALKKS